MSLPRTFATHNEQDLSDPNNVLTDYTYPCPVPECGNMIVDKKILNMTYYCGFPEHVCESCKMQGFVYLSGHGGSPVLGKNRAAVMLEQVSNGKGDLPPNKRRAVYGGHVDDRVLVCPSGWDEALECSSCGNKSFQHNHYSWWDEEKDDLLCEKCFSTKVEQGEDIKDYLRALAFL